MHDRRNNILVIGGILAALLILPLVVDNDKTLTIAILVFIIATLAASWNIVGGFTGQVSLGHAAFFGIGSLVTRLLWLRGVPLLFGIGLSGLTAAFAAVILGFPGLRLKGIYFSIGTLALAEAIRITVNNLLPGISALPAAALRDYSLVSRYYLTFAVLLLTMAVSYWLTIAKLGLGMMCVREDEDAARAIGVNVFWHKLSAFTISAALAGLAGSGFAYFHVSYYPSLTFSPEWTFDALIVTFVGGVGTVVGPLLGAVFFVLIRDVLAANLVGIHLLIFGVLFIVVVLLLPGGMMEAWDRWRAGKRPSLSNPPFRRPAKEND